MSAAEGQSNTPSAPPISRGGAIKIVISVVAVLAAVSTLFYFSAAPGMEYYKYVDEVVQKQDSFKGKRLKVHGYVVEDSIFKKKDSLDYKFKLQTKPPRAPAIIEAEYRGLVPDNFKPGAEVVARGTLNANNQLMVEHEGIDAKCPSKYEAGAAKLNPTATGPMAPAAAPTGEKTAQAQP
jgi:cytochrome c-type biogenesis protein CcmE